MAGIYIHIPFCKQKCTYCDFHFSTRFSKYRDKMIDAICAELKIRSNYLENRVIQTIYFGGGTPSILTSSELKSILSCIYEHYSVEANCEITLEANPDDISEQILELDSILDETSKELETLKSEVKEFGSTLESASSNIDSSVESVSDSVDNIEEASSQLNSLLFPIVASIGIIVALQVAILARRR